MNNIILFLFLFIILHVIYIILDKQIDSFISWKEYEKNIIYCFWTGKNEMSDNRKRCLENLKNMEKCETILITSDNLQDYILSDNPLHEAYEHLSETHKADYLRTYFMHFYGGGYSDIKSPSDNWENAFENMRNDEKMYINGYRETSAGDIAYYEVSDRYNELIGNGAYIVRPNTEFTNRWYNSMIQLMDSKLIELKNNPASSPQDTKGSSSGYPLEWNEMLGRIFHKELINCLPYILFTVPRPITSEYR